MKEDGVMSDRDAAELSNILATEAPILKEAEDQQNQTLHANYKAVNIDAKVETMDYLIDQQKQNLNMTLKKFPKLFSGGLGILDIEQVHLELKLGATPFHSRVYPVPNAYEKVTRKESDRFCDIGVFEEPNDSECASPTFIQPKKTGGIRVLTDF